jgi:hypothetical protein
MPKHLTPAVHESWLHRDDPTKYRDIEFPARPNNADCLSSGRRESCTGACGNHSTGTGEHPHSLSLTPPQGEPVPVGHLSLIERIKEAAK